MIFGKQKFDVKQAEDEQIYVFNVKQLKINKFMFLMLNSWRWTNL